MALLPGAPAAEPVEVVLIAVLVVLRVVWLLPDWLMKWRCLRTMSAADAGDPVAPKPTAETQQIRPGQPGPGRADDVGSSWSR